MNIKNIPYIWFNGKVMLQDEHNIPVLTHGLHYGTGAFEGIRVYNKKIFKLKEHIERLFNSAKILFMHIPFLATEIAQACEEIVELNQISNGYIRPLMFLDNQKMDIGGESSTNIMIACWPRISQYHESLQDKKPVSLKISSLIRPPAESFPYKAKISGLYVINYLAKKRALDKGYDDALMLDYRNYVAEATTSNFFMVKDGELHTPLPECCLDGITRRTIINIAKENQLKVNERYIPVEEIYQADEAFLTGTAAEIIKIASIHDHKYQENPITQILHTKFYQLTQNIT